MTIIEQLINTFNWAKIEGGELTESEKSVLREQVLAQVNLRQDIVMNTAKACRVPFYVYSRKDELKDFYTFNGYKPKTMIFYNNYCELELLRMAYLLDVLGEDKHWIYETTKQRIRGNCFGRFCPNGECFEASIATLRFVAIIFPREAEWINMCMKNIAETILVGNKKIPYQSKLYFLQTLCEINTDEALKCILMLKQCIHHLGSNLSKYASDYRRVNGQIIKACTLKVQGGM